MNRFWKVLSVLFLGVATMQAQHGPLQYHGGPVLESFTIYPLFYGKWNQTDIDAHQTFLVSLAAYISGAPSSEQPMMRQYGVTLVTVASSAKASPNAAPVVLHKADVRNIIHENQGAGGVLPAYGPHTLIVVFPAHGFSVDECGGCGAYHSSESNSSFFAVVPQDAGLGQPAAGPKPAPPGPFQLVTTHELFEASADPAVDNFQGWDETVDNCTDGMVAFGGHWINLSFGWIAGVHDNTQDGNCSTTGYTSTDEIQVYGYSYPDYRSKYDQLFPQGWRLYILQSYVLPNGQVLYNAAWRRGIGGEKQDYGVTYQQYRSDYDQLFPQGWRLYILQSYVLSDGQVRYNAVWRPGNLAEKQDYGVTYQQYRSDYDQLFPQGWRLMILQSYVLPNGQVLYNAVWRPGNLAEIQVYGYSYADYRSKYDELFPQGWRLYILDAYVLSNGQVVYNAVWRPGNLPEIQVYGYSYADYRSKYDQLFPQGWRLYVLQSYVLSNGQVVYNAVWRPGTFDRPL